MRDAVTIAFGHIVHAGKMRGQQFGLTKTKLTQVRIGRVTRSRLRGLPEDVVDRLPVPNEVQTHRRVFHVSSVQNCVMVKHVESENDSSLEENSIGNVWPARDDLEFWARHYFEKAV